MTCIKSSSSSSPLLACTQPAGQAPQLQRLRSLVALLVQQLLLLPPPVQHLLGGDSAGFLLRLALPCAEEEQATAEQAAALLWMLVQQQLSGHSRAEEVQLPGDAPCWLECGAGGLLPCGESSRGHAMLLGPLPEALQAASAELLSQLQRHIEGVMPLPEGQGSSDAARLWLCADSMLPAADACHAAIQLVLAEHGQQRQQAGGGEGSASGAEEEEEHAPQPALLLSSAAAVAGLAAALCQAGAAAAAELASQLDAAAGQQQQHQMHQPGAAAWAAARGPAAVQALCRQLLEPAVRLLDAGCLPLAALQQLQAAIEALNGQLEAVQQLAVGLPGSHALLATMLQAWEAAPTLWQPAAARHSSDCEAGGESSDGERPTRSSQGGQRPQEQGGDGSGAGQRSGALRRKGRRRKRLRDVRNPAVRAMLAEDGGAGDLDASDLSDLEDFLVFNPGAGRGAPCAPG